MKNGFKPSLMVDDKSNRKGEERTRMEKFNGFEEILEVLKQEGSSPMLKALQVVLNTVMLLERQQVLGVEPYERSEGRNGHANGFKPKNLNTRVGTLELTIPQTRGVEFYPSMLEKGQRSERALMAALVRLP